MQTMFTFKKGIDTKNEVSNQFRHCSFIFIPLYWGYVLLGIGI